MKKTLYKGEIVSYANMKNYYHCGYECSLPQSRLDYFVAELFISNKNVYEANYEIEVQDSEIKKILDKKYNFKTKYIADIIFEIVYDEHNNPYAKEIVTGKIFPILDKRDFTKTYKATYYVKNLDKDDDHKPYACNYEFTAEPVHHPTNPNILNLRFFVVRDSYSYPTQIEIEEYKKEFYPYTLFGFKTKAKCKDVFSRYINFSKNNTYKDNNFKDEKGPEIIPERESQSEYTIIMENIEFLLTQLGKIDLDLKKAMQVKYNIILEEEDKILTLEPFSIQKLKSFEAELEFVIKTKKKGKQSVIECLDNIIAEYNSSTKTQRTIKDVDKLSELFLKMKNDYSATDQRKIIEKFAYIYIHEIYENKDIITLDELSNSYYNDILKSIVIYISEMIDNDIIENNLIIDFNNITPESVLELIKQIKFKQIQNNKQKRIGEVNE